MITEPGQLGFKGSLRHDWWAAGCAALCGEGYPGLRGAGQWPGAGSCLPVVLPVRGRRGSGVQGGPPGAVARSAMRSTLDAGGAAP